MKTLLHTAAIVAATLSQPAAAEPSQSQSVTKSKARTADRNHAQMMAYIKS